MEKISKTEEEWKKELTSERYRILRKKETEPPFSGEYWDSHEKGIYVCAGCGAKLFSSETKFDFGTGWPSFYAPLYEQSVETKPDYSLGMARTEVLCGRCGGHLGHVFDDLPRRSEGTTGGSRPAGKRFCINSAALEFEKKQ